MSERPRRKRPGGSLMPGFYLTLGFTGVYLLVLVLIPLSGLFFETATLSPAEIWAAIATERSAHAYALSFGAAGAAALINTVFGLLVAWVLARYRFPGRQLIDALVDLPFALPTAVAGIALTGVYSERGWFGQFLEPLGFKVAYAVPGVILALTFVGLPFVVRTVQPVLQDLDPEVEEAAACLGATRWQTFVRVLLPPVLPALLTGFSLAFARALGEYGSVVFISGNLPMKTEIAPLLIMQKLEGYDVPGATAVALVLLLTSFVLLFVINQTQGWARRRMGAL